MIIIPDIWPDGHPATLKIRQHTRYPADHSACRLQAFNSYFMSKPKKVDVLFFLQKTGACELNYATDLIRA